MTTLVSKNDCSDFKKVILLRHTEVARKNSVLTLQPRKINYPYHQYTGNEEVFYIISGTAVILKFLKVM